MREAMLKRLNRIQDERNGHAEIRHGLPVRAEMTLKEANDVARSLGIPPVVHIGNGMYSVTCEITPKMCKEWLNNRNEKNRHENSTHAGIIGEDMLRGEFYLTHQGIAFDELGNIVDGQHRASACILSGASFWSMVSIYVARKSCPGIDTGRKRDWKATRIMQGENITHKFQATLSILASPNGNGMHYKSNSELDILAELYGDAIDFALESMSSTTRGVKRAAVWGAIARAWFHCNHDDLRRFCAVLTKCAASEEKPAEATIICLHRTLVTSGGKGGALVNQAMFSKTLSAINSYVNGKAVTRIYEAPDNLFPLPEPSRPQLFDKQASTT